MNALSHTDLEQRVGAGGARPVSVTLFYNYAAGRKTERVFSLPELREAIVAKTAAKKADLPWIKLARFGDTKTDKGSLRHDGNVLAITGIEADYDGERIAPTEAVERLEKAGILALVYTSPRHTEDAPRWRVLCPTSVELPPERRQHLMGRLNGLFGGIFSGESWALSQSYYFGSVNSNPSHMAELVDGMPIDLCDELDEVWTGKPGTTPASPGVTRNGRADVSVLLAEIVTADNYHEATVRLAGVWARAGVAYLDARTRLLEAYDAVEEKVRDARWQTRRTDVDRCLEDIYGKQAKARDAAGEQLQPDGDAESARRVGSDRGRGRDEPEPWPAPIDFLGDSEMTGAPELKRHHLPEAIAPFVFDTAGRMGVDSAVVALAAVVSLASVVNEAWALQPKRHDDSWTENARLWAAIVGPPSILKSPVIRAATKPLDRLEAEARERHAAETREWKASIEQLKADRAPKPWPSPPRCDRFLAEGTTVEALSELMRDDDEARFRLPAGKVLVRQDELSEWVAGMDQYRSGGRGGADRGAYLRLFNGGRYTVDRVGRGSFAIPNWSACLLGGVQPEPIQRIARDAADDGLLQRFLFVVPAAQGEGEDRRPDEDATARYAALFPALVGLRPARGGRATVLHEEAHVHREEVASLVKAMSGMPDTSARMQAALGKWAGIFARIALTFHLIDLADARARGDIGPTPGVVTEQAARRTEAFMRDVLLPHLLRADALLFQTSQTSHARWIAGYILANEDARTVGRVTLRDVQKSYSPLRAPEHRRVLTDTLSALEVVGWLRAEWPDNPARPITVWQVNPALHSTFAARAKEERRRRDIAKADAIAAARRGSGR